MSKSFHIHIKPYLWKSLLLVIAGSALAFNTTQAAPCPVSADGRLTAPYGNNGDSISGLRSEIYPRYCSNVNKWEGWEACSAGSGKNMAICFGADFYPLATNYKDCAAETGARYFKINKFAIFAPDNRSCDGPVNHAERTIGIEPSSSNTGTAKEQIEALEKSGAIPALERGDTLTGADENNNGVRDDIDDYINKNYTIEPKKSAATQSARAFQKALLVDKSNISDVKEAMRNISRANGCIYQRFDGKPDPARVSSEIKSITTNTKRRLLAYLSFSKALGGTSWTIQKGDTCE